MNARKDQPGPSVQSWVALALAVGGGTIIVVLLARTAIGAIHQQFPAWLIAGLAACGFALTMTAWRLDDAAGTGRNLQRRTARAAAAVLSGVFFGLLVARASTAGIVSVAVMALTWSVAAAFRIRPGLADDVQRAVRSRTLRRSTSAGAGPRSSPGVPVGSNSTVLAAEPAESAIESAFADDADVRMEFRRRQTVDGETIEVHARLEFVAGAREAVLHIPFWPALAGEPIVDCEPLDADDVELRVTTAEPYGIRLEARLPAATPAARTVLIGVEVRACADQSMPAAA